jgi:hypothetical protein
MSRRQVTEIEGAKIEAINDDVIERLDEEPFGPEDDPTDRLDEFVVDIKIVVRTREDVEQLRAWCDDDTFLVIANEL